MMIRKYKIGNFTIAVRTQVDFQDAEPFSLFWYEGDETDYCVDVDFSTELTLKTTDLCYDSQERVGVFENNQLHFYYKSHDNDKEYFAYRTKINNKISIVIDDMYREKLSSRVVF